MDKLIGVDIGYGLTKIYNADVARNFPSTVSSQVSEQTFRATLNPLVICGQTYLVGEEALVHSRSTEDTRHDRFLCSPGWFALLGYALHLADFDPTRHGAVLAIGLPPGDAGSERTSRVRRAVQQTSIVMKSSGNTLRFDETRILIVPQGVGIFYCYARGHEEALSQHVAVVDIGHQTLDLVYMSKGSYVERFKQTQDLGISAELDRLIQMGRSMPVAKRFGYDQLSEYVEDGSLFDSKDDHYIHGAENHLRAYTHNVISMIDRFVKSLPRDPDVCLIGGGGAKFLDPHIKSQHDLLVAADAHMANAIGYHTYASWLLEMEV